MAFNPKPKFYNDELRGQIARYQEALEQVSAEFSGRPVDIVSEVLQRRVAKIANAASISGQELATGAHVISEKKRFWVTDDGKLMADDQPHHLLTVAC